MYIEASSPRRQGDNAKMSITLPVSRNSCLRFYYHMYGKYIGALKVEVGGSTVFQKSGNQGNKWSGVEVRLPVSGSLEVTYIPN